MIEVGELIAQLKRTFPDARTDIFVSLDPEHPFQVKLIDDFALAHDPENAATLILDLDE